MWGITSARRSVKPPKALGGEHDRLGQEGHARERTRACETVHGLSLGQAERPGLAGRGPRLLPRQDLRFGKVALAATKKAPEGRERDAAMLGHGDEGAAALAPHEQVLAGHRFERLADRALADADLACSISLGMSWPVCQLPSISRCISSVFTCRSSGL
ncbi:MAG TPA: hypothetical protein VFR34_04070 [Paracoccaceae bacterium]|nr:hypothetical protein [Paracoccaceae bacterium]